MPEYISDGTLDFSLGQDAWHYPQNIRDNQYAAGVNVSTKGGLLSTRNGFHEIELIFDKKAIVTKYGYSRSIASIWRTGKFQAAIPHKQASFSYIFTIISGLIFRTDAATRVTTLFTEEFMLDQFLSRVNWSVASNKIVLFDFPNYPLVIDGDKIFRCSPTHTVNGLLAPQIPVSTVGTYNQNRLFIANAGVEFTAGDAIGDLATPEAPITFTEVYTPSSPFYKQEFSLPTEDASYPIVAMGFIQQLDSSTGIGPMFVATTDKFYFYQTNQPRAQWGINGQFGGVLLANAGIAGPRAFVNVNSDLIFLDSHGRLRALSTSRNQSARWSNVPISREVDNWLLLNEPGLSQFAIVEYFNNRIYISANPYRINAQTRASESVTDYAHGGFVVLSIDSLSSFMSQGTPIWEGLYTGINPVEFIHIGERAFVISKDGCGGNAVNALYEVQTESKIDSVQGRDRRIRSVIYTKQYDFKNPSVQKKEHSLAVVLSGLSGKVDLTIERKPSHAMEFLDYAKWSYTALTTNCMVPEDGFFNGLAQHNFKQLIFGDPTEEGCSPISQEDYKIYLATQLRITLEGEWVFESVRISATPFSIEERQQEFVCEPKVGEKIPLKCNTDWMIPGESVCLP